MIVIPAIVMLILEAAAIGGLAGAVICGMEDRRTLPPDAGKSQRTAHKCAAEGALVGGVFGAGSAVVGPLIGGVGSVVDDMALPALNSADDIARSGAGLADDAARISKPRAWRFTRVIRRDIKAPIRHEANVSRVSYHRSLRVPKNANSKAGFVYVAEVKGVSNAKLYKIGYTKRPPQRLLEIQSKLKRTVGGKANYTCIIYTKNMFQLESMLLSAFDPHNLRNFAAGTEFFHLSPSLLNAACSF